MPGYDWALLADRGGEAVEGLIATFLTLRYPQARQVNPSQGDGGIDVLLETPDGLEVWQVKKFTRPLDANQMAQVRGSWERFNREYVDRGTTVVRYHLVTPWTPTRERYTDFEALTENAPFPAQWDGEAFINGLADAYPATMDRFVNGPGAFERFVTQRAMLASSPVERSGETTMLEAIDIRQDALDELRESVSDNYRIEHGTRTVANASVPPIPDLQDPAVFHRMTYIGDNRWKTESVVPRTADATSNDPIHLEVAFLVEEGSLEASALRDWEEWGIPFTDIPARTVTHGGPFDGEAHDDSHLSFVQTDQAGPTLFFVVRDGAGAVRLRLPLSVLERTRGMRTGWLRVIAETPRRVLRFEMRSKGANQDPTFAGTLGDVDGLDPVQVLDEANLLLTVEATDTFALELQNGMRILGGSGLGLPSALDEYFRPVASALANLQASTTQTLIMPDVQQVTLGQLRALERYQAIYGGTAEEWTWSQASLTVPTDPTDAAIFLGEQLPGMLEGRWVPVVVEQPLVSLADRAFLVERPLVTTRRSFRLAPGVDLATLQPGDTVPLIPGDDDRVTTAAVVDWTPGSVTM